ncbi:MAG TPA: peptidoglycan-binding domain-containing protein, partial [Polyangiaceae bacterium]|nr:peptidoglycan-binding domain-containing protein [Polyangiaceae bacterium]
MANGVRVLLRPIIEKWPKGELVSGVTIGLEIFGKGPGLNKGEVKPAKLILHGAFLKKARDEKKDRPKFEKFATITGKIRLTAGKPVFELEPAGKIEYAKPEPAKPTFRRVDVKYQAPAFSGAPSPPLPKPDEAPPEPHPLLRLRLPEEPKGMRFAIVGAELEIAGASSSGVADNDLLDVPLPPIQLKIIKIDHHFAPSKENLEIKYKIGGLLGARVMLEVTSKHYAAGPILKRALLPAELIDGLHTLTWDGKCNALSGDLKARFLNPLFAPYEVKLSDGSKHEAKGGFAVLYHSLELALGDWTPDAKVPDKASKKNDWVQYKLNELGYFGGPVGHDFDDYLKKAVIRYKANHKKMHELVVSNYNATITADLEAALSAGDNRRTFLDGDALKDPKKSSRILLEALTYENKASGDEFAESKATHEPARLNRPLLPMQANIFLLGKTTTKVRAPEAVGKARVNWRFTDVPEDLTKQFASTASQPSKTRAYVEKALKLKGGRSGTNGDNCHKD